MRDPQQQARDKFMAFLITSMGANIAAPMPLIEEELKNYKHIKSLDESDEALDCAIALDKVESPEERMEIVQILVMKYLRANDIHQMVDNLHDYTEHLLEYARDHEDARDPNAEKNAKNAMDGLMDGLFGI